MDEKQKVAIVGVLFVAIATVGVFQFVNSTGPATAPARKATKKAVAQDAPTKEVKNPLVAIDLPERDPFRAGTLPSIDGLGAPDPVQKPANRGDSKGLPELPPLGEGSLQPGKIGLAPVQPPKPEFGYGLSGVIVGSRPAAVFVDAQGAQRLVPLGGSLDGDTQVIGVEKGRVTVRFRGTTLRLSPGGNGSGN